MFKSRSFGWKSRLCKVSTSISNDSKVSGFYYERLSHFCFEKGFFPANLRFLSLISIIFSLIETWSGYRLFTNKRDLGSDEAWLFVLHRCDSLVLQSKVVFERQRWLFRIAMQRGALQMLKRAYRRASKLQEKHVIRRVIFYYQSFPEIYDRSQEIFNYLSRF